MLLKVSAGGPPPGTYGATFNGVEATAHEEFGPGLRWTWTIVQGPQQGQIATRVTNATPTAKNACGRILAGLVGRKIEPYEEIDAQSFVGNRYLIVVADAERGGTRVETVIASPPTASPHFWLEFTGVTMSTTPESPPENHLLQAALDYASRGWPVLPLHSIANGACTCDDPSCEHPGKHPLTIHGVYDATTNEATIRRYWREAPTANVGIRTGSESNLLVLDADGEEGILALARLEAEHGALPPTPRVATGGGGLHYYFAYPTDSEVPSSTHVHGLRIDVRGRGGYVVAPPSRHHAGNFYEWMLHPDDIPVARAPDWLLNFVRGGRSATSPSSLSAQPARGGIILRVEAADLQDAPGVGEGQRHTELCRLVGCHLEDGDDVAVVEPLALTWAARCTPALPESEARRIVHDLGARHTEQASRSIVLPTQQIIPAPANIDTIPLPRERPWPVLHADALYGLAGDVVRRIEPTTEADPVAILGQFIVHFGSTIGRSAHAVVEADRHYGNLFLVLVGRTSRGRKGSSAGRVKALFRRTIGEVLLGSPLQTGLSTGEGLIWAVRDPIIKHEPIKQAGQITGYQDVVADPGVEDKRLLIEEPEFVRVLKVARREGNTLSPVIRAAWDDGNLSTLTKNSPAVATDAHIALIGHGTEEELTRHLNETEVANGYANRHLWACVRRSKQLPEGGRPARLDDLIDRLAEAILFARGVGLVIRTPEATELWCAEYSRLSAGRVGMFGAVTGRAEAQVLRLSLLYALLDMSSVVRVEHLLAALAFWRYCEDSARRIFGESLGDPLSDRIAEMIRATPGLTRTDLHRSLGGHLTGENLVGALAHLRDAGAIRIVHGTNGRRTIERWYPSGHSPTDCGIREFHGSCSGDPPPTCSNSRISHNSQCEDQQVAALDLRNSRISQIPDINGSESGSDASQNSRNSQVADEPEPAASESLPAMPHSMGADPDDLDPDEADDDLAAAGQDSAREVVEL